MRIGGTPIHGNLHVANLTCISHEKYCYGWEYHVWYHGENDDPSICCVFGYWKRASHVDPPSWLTMEIKPSIQCGAPQLYFFFHPIRRIGITIRNHSYWSWSWRSSHLGGNDIVLVVDLTKYSQLLTLVFSTMAAKTSPWFPIWGVP